MRREKFCSKVLVIKSEQRAIPDAAHSVRGSALQAAVLPAQQPMWKKVPPAPRPERPPVWDFGLCEYVRIVQVQICSNGGYETGVHGRLVFSKPRISAFFQTALINREHAPFTSTDSRIASAWKGAGVFGTPAPPAGCTH